jgi:hypothetical protein
MVKSSLRTDTTGYARFIRMMRTRSFPAKLHKIIDCRCKAGLGLIFILNTSARDASKLAYEKIVFVEINARDCHRFFAGGRLCDARTGRLPAVAPAAISTSTRGQPGNPCHGSAASGDCGKANYCPRPGFYLDWGSLRLARSLGMGTWPLGTATASRCRLGAASL